MRLSQAWIVARHDLAMFRQKQGILIGLIAFPFGVGLGFPALVEVILSRSSTDATAWLPIYLQAFSFWFVIGSASLPTTIAAYSIVGEKISKSLEPLLSTPTTDGEILVGKGLAVFLPTLAGVWGGSTLFQLLIDLETRSVFGHLYYPNGMMIALLFLLVPLVILLAIEASVIISSHVTDIRSAQQYASIIVLPLILVYVASEVVLNLDLTTVLYMAAAFLAAVLALYAVTLRTFHREEILTRWK